MNPLTKLHSHGQSFWYDNIRRSLLVDGAITSLISQDDLRGMTSNPSIFANAIGSSADYDGQIKELASAGLGAEEIYEQLAITDIRTACDLFAEVYQASRREDGYVSLEVSPHLAHDEQMTVAEAKRLFRAVDRPNLMIKVPATEAGVKAVRRLIANGININITLMFNMKHYEAVADAYLAGLKTYMDAGGEVEQVASVASFFVSRVDSVVDGLLLEMGDARAVALQGKTAIANSKLVYQRYKEVFGGDEFEAQRGAGAQVQRLLWASTSTKNPDYVDTLYVDELIGRDTVNTMPPKTIDAFRDHGQVALTLENGVDEARRVVDEIAEMGIDLEKITQQLQRDGLVAFADSYDELLKTLALKLQALSSL